MMSKKRRIPRKAVYQYWIIFSIIIMFLASIATTLSYWFILNFFDHGIFITHYEQKTFTIDFYILSLALWCGIVIVLNVVRILINLSIVKKYSSFFLWVYIMLGATGMYYIYYLAKIAPK